MQIFIKSITVAVIGVVKLYQVLLSPILPGSCRHQPTCSEYYIQALRTHGLFKGLYIGSKRLLRCRPGGTSGYDPVPKNNGRS